MPAVYSNSVGNSWNLRSVTGLAGWLALPFYFLVVIPVTCSLISHLILTISISLLFPWTIFFVTIKVTFLSGRACFLRRVSTVVSATCSGTDLTGAGFTNGLLSTTGSSNLISFGFLGCF